MAVTVAPFGGYSDDLPGLTAAKTAAINAEIEKLADLLCDTNVSSSTNTSNTSPDFDKIPIEMKTAIRAEITALKAAITAAPDT